MGTIGKVRPPRRSEPARRSHRPIHRFQALLHDLSNIQPGPQEGMSSCDCLGCSSRVRDTLSHSRSTPERPEAGCRIGEIVLLVRTVRALVTGRPGRNLLNRPGLDAFATPPGPSGEASAPAGTRGDIAATIGAAPVQVASRGGTPGEPWGPPGRRRSVGRAISRCAGDRARQCRVITGHTADRSAVRASQPATGLVDEVDRLAVAGPTAGLRPGPPREPPLGSAARRSVRPGVIDG
jgi:hypothetical protein